MWWVGIGNDVGVLYYLLFIVGLIRGERSSVGLARYRDTPFRRFGIGYVTLLSGFVRLAFCACVCVCVWVCVLYGFPLRSESEAFVFSGMDFRRFFSSLFLLHGGE